MCGIVAAIADHDIVSHLLAGLQRLEYRGYDSSGIAVLAGDSLRTIRRVGRVSQLAQAVQQEQVSGQSGIGHTRWATHGGVTEANAHPHASGDLAVVHNGIIENHETLRAELQAAGFVFQSQTDTEVIAHLLQQLQGQGMSLADAVYAAAARMEGAYAFAVLSQREPEQLYAVRMGCPLLLGVGEGGHYLGSDISALLAITRRVVYLADGDVLQLARESYRITDLQGRAVERPIQQSDLSLAALELGPYSHYMQKEIHEQPKALADTLEQVFETGFGGELFGLPDMGQIASVQIIACGTSYYAGLVARYWIEALAGIPASVDIASEYRYHDVVVPQQQLVVVISQSGETLDTLEALKHAQRNGARHTLALCNVREAAIARQAGAVCYTRAGAEIGVASTKAFTTQLALLFVLAASLAHARKRLDASQQRSYLDELRNLPGSVQHALNLEPQIRSWAEHLARQENALYLGRGTHYPIALEGALKLKEISYIHAEGYAAGELKHGPLALVDEHMPVVVIAPNDQLLEKLKGNMHEVRARGGELFVFSDLDSHFSASDGVRLIRTPRHVGLLSPIVHAIPVQLLAYHTALLRGTDVDKPRNLAKSVTVE